MKKRAIAYWLIPAETEQELFRHVVRILGKEFHAPRFTPHLTVFVAARPHSAKKVLETIRFAPVRLRVRRVAFSSKFRKTLYVRFAPNPALNRLVSALSEAVASNGQAEKDPHVSLVYKKLPRSVKKDLAATIRLPFQTVIFNSLHAVRCPLRTSSAADVKAWRTVARKSLKKSLRQSRRR